MIPNYGHLDIFFGKNAAKDVFPLISAELDRATRANSRADENLLALPVLLERSAGADTVAQRRVTITA